MVAIASGSDVILVPQRCSLCFILYRNTHSASSTTQHLSRDEVKSLVEAEVREAIIGQSVVAAQQKVKEYPAVAVLPASKQLRILVTGGAGALS